jgi:hypothetical protein
MFLNLDRTFWTVIPAATFRALSAHDGDAVSRGDGVRTE